MLVANDTNIYLNTRTTKVRVSLCPCDTDDLYIKYLYCYITADNATSSIRSKWSMNQ